MPKRIPSLKTLIPILAKAMGLTPAALYERQRVLVRIGLLVPRPGRGPGSGVPADAKSMAMLLASVLATGSLSEVAERTKKLVNLKAVAPSCPMTGKRTFGQALTAILSSVELADLVGWIDAARSGTKAGAEIIFMLPRETSPPPKEMEQEGVTVYGMASGNPNRHWSVGVKFGKKNARFGAALSERTTLSEVFFALAKWLEEEVKQT